MDALKDSLRKEQDQFKNYLIKQIKDLEAVVAKKADLTIVEETEKNILKQL